MGAWGHCTPAYREAETASAFATKKRMSLFASAENPMRTPLVPFKMHLSENATIGMFITHIHTHTHSSADGPGID